MAANFFEKTAGAAAEAYVIDRHSSESQLLLRHAVVFD
jgi:hypothetical protein